nr:carboxypeptidase regulatory-like domain-containing protein [Candidatus Levybacteria bacterium]
MFKTLKIKNSLKIENLKFKISLAVLISLILILNSVTAYASSFNQAYIRLDNLSANTALSGTICADPSSAGAGTEAKIAITFPSDFTINTTTSNWTTSVTNLPAGATNWPSIGATATSVSGQTVTFASGDLTASTLYCFNFTGSSSTTGSAGTEKTGTLVSKNSSDTTIDSTTYALAIVSSGNINITASVDPQVSDLPIAIQSTTVGTTFPQDTTINYKITYGNSATTSIPLTIQAQWTQGTIAGNPSPSVDILDYVVGSASNAYSSTPAVINTVNRTITWTISSISGSTTGQTVTFSLKTNSSYTGGSTVSFSVLARATSGSTTTPDASISQNYLFSGTSNPGGPGDQKSDNLGCKSRDCSTPTITQPALPIFNSIEIYSISSSYAKIFVATNKSTTLTIRYGKSLKSLLQNIKTALPATENIVTLPDLETDTDYYFKVTAKDTSGNTVTSDIFTFKTASKSFAPSIDLQSLVITSNNNILLNPQGQLATGQTAPKYIIVIPYSSVFEFHFILNKKTQIKNIQAIVRNKNVLGASTFGQPEANSNLTDLVETRPGVYTGRLLSPKTPGNYELYVKIIDYSGNITIQKIAELKVVNKFKVLEKGLKNPIENARVLFYLYNPTTKVYEVISPQILPISNPSYSNPQGLVDVILPIGKYKAEILAIGYNDSKTEFELNPEYGEYPTIYLEKQPFNIINYINYYSSTFFDNLSAGGQFIKSRADSSRLFDFITVGSLFIFVFTTLFAFSAKTHIPIFYLPLFLIYKTDLFLRKNKSYVIFGKVVEDTTRNPVSRVIVSLIDANNNTIATLKTNKLGEFYYPNVNLGNYKISVTKKGFLQSSPINYKKEDKIIPLTISIKKDESKLERNIDNILIYAVDFVGLFFEFMLTIGIIIEIFFIQTFGFLRIAPFMAISTTNLLLLFLFLYKPKNLKN